MSHDFDPADAGCWEARGRPAHHAAVLSHAWRCFPDLPPEAPLDARMARTRERVAMLRPLHEAISAETEQARQRTNFAFVERQISQGSTDSRHSAILRGRDVHGYDWNTAWSYADGYYAACAGWDFRFSAADHYSDVEQRRRAYDHGFRDGGGDPDDIFDAARRALVAKVPIAEPSPRVLSQARPSPSQWPMPTDTPAPVSWRRRLLVLGEAEAAGGPIGFLAMLGATVGHDAARILVADPQTGFRPIDAPNGHETLPHATTVDELLASGSFDDILIAVADAELPIVDAHALRLPIARNMERTRNSVIQQRAQFRIWLARGWAPGDQFAAGHIRWGKMAAGLTGRLGEFTARYVGPAQPRGHRIIIEDAGGSPARGYHSARGEPLDPEIVITNRARLRPAMAEHLRRFGASLRF